MSRLIGPAHIQFRLREIYEAKNAVLNNQTDIHNCLSRLVRSIKALVNRFFPSKRREGETWSVGRKIRTRIWCRGCWKNDLGFVKLVGESFANKLVDIDYN